MSMTASSERVGSDTSWQTTHERLVQLARERAGLDFEEGRWLLAARRAAVHRELGYGSFTEYVERLFGYAPRVTHDKLRVAAALQRLPALSDRLGEGELSYSHARELTRVATPETEQKWLEAARGRTVREVEKLVAGRRPGSLPGAPSDSKLERHVLRFEVSGETLASFREMVAQLRHEAGEHLEDDAVLMLVARRVLGGPTDEGRASYQIALDVCEQCQRARQVADGDTVEVSRAAREMAHCDAQQIPIAHVGMNETAAMPRATGGRITGDSAFSATPRSSSVSGAGLSARHQG
jgi:HTH domain found in ParB protein